MKVSAPGKIILAGEHAVVYGKPALVAAVNRRLTVNFEEKENVKIEVSSEESSQQIEEAVSKFRQMYVATSDRGSQPTTWVKIKVESEIPVKVGMGSSAAVAVATIGGLLAFSQKLKDFSSQDKKTINKIAYEVEKRVHGTPSGVDNTISTFGGLLWFKKGKPFKKIKLKNLPRFVLVNTGRAEETTGEMVKRVKSKIKYQKAKTEKIFDKIEEETKKLLLGLRKEDKEEIMEAIKGCEENLERLGVVGEFAEKVVRAIEGLGGVAKVCGAGGVKDRSGILLCYHKRPEKIFALAKKLGLETFAVKLGEEGVRVE